MNNTNGRGHGPEGIVVVINGTPTTVTAHTLTFEALAALAFPAGLAENAVYTVTYRNAADHHGPGVLLAGESVRVKERGTVFDVTLTTNS